ncbi:LysE family translocator [Photobacterium sp. OFAV2-7]|uniref:LysE family translocator n=1 Tax=Photobacterium sp. OFAV2-7 TaxID=2917748 RepID=UPI001EF49C59|nr:LysE family transporter [Photobacterium sp. OFAV2-7]MCG7586044.1 LysE family transporter [Photobacterium sp. OFAV2-7]
MSEFSILLSSMVICLFGVMSPGPSFVAVTNKALISRREHALWLTAGIALINALWAACALFGLKALITQLSWLLIVIRICGAVYLIWFGIQLFRKPVCSLGNASADGVAADTGKLTAFREGVLTNLCNPKSLLFYSSIFSVSIPETTGYKLLIELIAIVFVISAGWYGSLAIILTTSRVQRMFGKVQGFIQKLCGGLLIIFGSRQLCY